MKSELIRVSSNLKKYLDIIKEEFKKTYSIEISYSKASDILANKIALAGGVRTTSEITESYDK